MKSSFLLFLLLLSPYSTAAAPAVVVGFSELWAKIEAHSPTQQAAEFELDAAKTAADRSGRHWFPLVYLEGRTFATNDPGVSLFSTLSQRAMSPMDFSPDNLNHPDTLRYEKLTLGVNLPLFEGGTRVAQHAAAQKMSDAKGFEGKAMKLKIYTESARLYGEIVAAEQTHQKLTVLAEVVDQVVSHYRVGGKDNPVGYSGLLGLKSVRHRISGALIENRAKWTAMREALGRMAGSLPENWAPAPLPTLVFVQKYLDVKISTKTPPDSYRVLSFEQMASAAGDSVGVERAKFLPKVGLFAEGSLNHGNRDSATSFVGGAYLQWDLFMAPNFGAVHQAESTRGAAQAHVDELRLQEGIENQGNLQAVEALEANLKILDDSSALLDEQTLYAKKLFLSGAMNALQLAEVLNRRTDLIASFGAAKTQYLQTKASLVNNGVIHD
ncbi:TolC family protein [Bdellovibrionota bacterium FG-1]